MKKTDNYELNELILRVKNRDDNAFSELVSRYSPMMNKVISGFSGSLVSHSEAFSEACVALHRAALSYDVTNVGVTFGLYARICVYRRLVDLFSKTLKDDLTVDYDVDKIAVFNNPETRLVNIERMREYYSKARSILSAYEYEIFVLYVEGCDTKAMAQKLSKTVKSVENAKMRMFRRLREESALFSND